MNIKKILALTIAAAAAIVPASAFDLKDLLGGDTGQTLGNIIEGVFTKTDLDVKDLAGTWQATGSAVTFKSDNFLQKAGGLAGAAAIETKLNPYFERYGLTGAEMAIDADGNMTLKIKKINLKGTITKGTEPGTFQFDFKAFGAVKITSLTAYVEKSPKNLNVMFDASKLKSFISVVANISGMSLAKTVGSILDSYEGACIGFKMNKIGDAPNSSDNSKNVQSKEEGGSGIGNALRGLLGGKDNESTQTQPAEPVKTQEPEKESSKGADLLRGLLGGSKK